MNENIRNILFVVFIVLPGVASTPAIAAKGPPAPLGFAIGQATMRDVQSELKKKTTVERAGESRFSHGPVLVADGHGLGLDNLRVITMAFNQDNRLVAMVMVFDKVGLGENFDPLYRQLASKYPVIQKRLPFVGNKFVQFQQDDVLIELEAPHLGWDINLTYKTREFDDAAKRQRKREQQQKSDSERKQL